MSNNTNVQYYTLVILSAANGSRLGGEETNHLTLYLLTYQNTCAIVALQYRPPSLCVRREGWGERFSPQSTLTTHTAVCHIAI